MCSPVGHSLMGAVIYVAFNRDRLNVKENWKGYLSYVIVANVPDLDIIPGMLKGDINLYHHQITHTLFFAALFTLGVYVFYRPRGEKITLRKVLPFFLLYLSHLVLDFFAVDTKPPYGEELFWPFTANYYISSVTPFLDIVRGRTLLSAINMHNLKAVLVEIAAFGPILLVAMLYQKSRVSFKELHNDVL